MTIGTLLFPSLGSVTQTTTNWSFIAAGSGQSRTTSSATTVFTMKPNVGDLMVCGCFGRATGTIPTSLAVTDTGSSGWTAALTAVSNTGTGHLTGLFFKTATSADFNGGSGITVTVTQSGGGANFITGGNGDVFRLSSGSVTGKDLSGSVVQTTGVTTLSANPGAGSGQPANIDELAYAFVDNPAAVTGVPTGTNTFTGTSAAANLAVTQSGLEGQFFAEWVGLVQASATAGSNTWVATWSGSAASTMVCATFYHS